MKVSYSNIHPFRGTMRVHKIYEFDHPEALEDWLREEGEEVWIQHRADYRKAEKKWRKDSK